MKHGPTADRLVFMESAGGAQVPRPVIKAVTRALSARWREVTGSADKRAAKRVVRSLLGASSDATVALGCNTTQLFRHLANALEPMMRAWLLTWRPASNPLLSSASSSSLPSSTQSPTPTERHPDTVRASPPMPSSSPCSVAVRGEPFIAVIATEIIVCGLPLHTLHLGCNLLRERVPRYAGGASKRAATTLVLQA